MRGNALTHTRTTSRRWKLARRVALILILGAIVNVGVAFACLFTPEPESWWIYRAEAENTEEVPYPARPSWVRPTIFELCKDEWVWTVTRGFGWRRDRVSGGFSRDAPLRTDTNIVSGLPFVSFTGSFYSVAHSSEYSDRKRLGLYNWMGELVPTRPRWLGFMLNTLFYAAVLYIPFVSFAASKRRWRIRRGLCPACAYELAGLTTCPECGRPTLPSPRRGEDVGAADR